MEKEIKAKSYTIRYKNGAWLGQVVITSDGMFAANTDYGNFSYCWRSYSEVDFRQFLVDLNVSYFAGKMAGGMAYVAHSRKIDKAAEVFANNILPPFQALLREDILTNPTF